MGGMPVSTDVDESEADTAEPPEESGSIPEGHWIFWKGFDSALVFYEKSKILQAIFGTNTWHKDIPCGNYKELKRSGEGLYNFTDELSGKICAGDREERK